MSNHFAWSVPNEGDCLCFSRSVLASKLLLCFSLFFLLGLIQRVFCLSSATQSLHMANHFKQDGSIMALFTNHKIFNQFTNPVFFIRKRVHISPSCDLPSSMSSPCPTFSFASSFAFASSSPKSSSFHLSGHTSYQ